MTDPTPDHADRLSLAARADADTLKPLAEVLLPELPEIEVVESRTGLVMLPLRDPVTATDFHLGEVLVAEAHIRGGGQDGYGMRTGRDLEAAMAMAVVDLADHLGTAPDRLAAFFADQRAVQAAEDSDRLKDVEATRVSMETF